MELLCRQVGVGRMGEKEMPAGFVCKNIDPSFQTKALPSFGHIQNLESEHLSLLSGQDVNFLFPRDSSDKGVPVCPSRPGHWLSCLRQNWQCNGLDLEGEP